MGSGWPTWAASGFNTEDPMDAKSDATLRTLIGE
jgi:hypothetical protein